MPKRLKASQLYAQGRFNYATIIGNPDGSTTITCAGVQAPEPYTFRAHRFLEKDEVLLEDPELELADEPAAHPEPAEG
jgi:hypothetical protein